MEFKTTVSTPIKASAEKVWQTLTSPTLIKQYMYNADTESDWKVGSPIVFTVKTEDGDWVERGEITELVPLKKLSYTDLSMDLEDKPENYLLVTYELQKQGGLTVLAVTQERMKDEATPTVSSTSGRKQ